MTNLPETRAQGQTAMQIAASIERPADLAPGTPFLTDEQRSATRAKAMTDGVIESASLIHSFSGGGVETAHLRDWTEEAAKAVHAGDLSRAETLLISQSLALNSIFGHYARKAATAEFIDKAERLMRLALRAQNQARMTLETLAAIKNPLSGAYVRQANLASGHQQVNNGPPPACACKSETGRIEQSRGPHGQQLDCGTQAAPKRGHTPVAAVEEINRPQDQRRETPVGKERVRRRTLEGGARDAQGAERRNAESAERTTPNQRATR